MGGKPCIRGMRVTVGMIVEALSAGRAAADFLNDFPYLEERDILEALGFAAQTQWAPFTSIVSLISCLKLGELALQMSDFVPKPLVVRYYSLNGISTSR